MMASKMDEIQHRLDALTVDCSALNDRVDAVAKHRLRKDAGNWDESAHKRAPDGKFGSGGGKTAPGGHDPASARKVLGLPEGEKKPLTRGQKRMLEGVRPGGANEDDKKNQAAFLEARNKAYDEMTDKLGKLGKPGQNGLSHSAWKKQAGELDKEYQNKVKEAQTKFPFKTSRPGVLDSAERKDAIDLVRYNGTQYSLAGIKRHLEGMEEAYQKSQRDVQKWTDAVAKAREAVKTGKLDPATLKNYEEVLGRFKAADVKYPKMIEGYKHNIRLLETKGVPL